MWILVGRGVGERRRLFLLSDLDLDRDLTRAWFLSSRTGDFRLFTSFSFVSSLSFSFTSFSFSLSLSLSLSLRSLLRRAGLLVERERRLGRLRSLSLLELDDSDELLLERELVPELELLDDREVDELLSEELKTSVFSGPQNGNTAIYKFFCFTILLKKESYLLLLSLLLDPESLRLFLSLPRSFFLSLSSFSESEPGFAIFTSCGQNGVLNERPVFGFGQFFTINTSVMRKSHINQN
jgi:hypothetical protein